MILIVDDDPATCRVMQKLLVNYGYIARTAQTVDEAQKFVNEEVPQLIILDVTVQNLSGLDLLKTLRSDPRMADVPILIHTAAPIPASEHEAKKLGADGLLMKGSFDVTFMINRIRAFVEPDRASPKPPTDQNT